MQLLRAEIEAAFKDTGLSWAAARRVLLENADCSLVAVWILAHILMRAMKYGNKMGRYVKMDAGMNG